MQRDEDADASSRGKRIATILFFLIVLGAVAAIIMDSGFLEQKNQELKEEQRERRRLGDYNN